MGAVTMKAARDCDSGGPSSSAQHWARMLLVLMAGVLMFSLAGAPYARACSCVPTTVDEAIAEDDLIAEITIIGRTGTIVGGGGVAYDARVERVWKGEERRRIIFRSAEHIAACGLGRIPTGTTLLAWARGENGVYSMAWCDIPDDAGDDPRSVLTAKVGEPADLTGRPVPFALHDLLPDHPLATVGLALLVLVGIGHRVLTAVVVATVLRRAQRRP